MPRKPRIRFPGALYHVTARGNNGSALYLDDRDRDFFLSLLGLAVRSRAWRCHVFCLMGNHYHLLVETPNGDIAEGMQRLNGDFARGFNRRHGRRGHVFEQRYHAHVVARQRHLLEACRYVVLNPVRAGLCSSAADWRWSSYRATAGLAPAPPFLTVSWLHAQLGRDAVSAQIRYVAFVSEGTPFASMAGLLAGC